MTNRTRAVIVAVLCGALVAAAAVSLLRSERETEPITALRVLDQRQLGKRLLEFTTSTSSLPRHPKVRVLLPRGYEGGDQEYPVLYLLHGAGADSSFWTESGMVAVVRGLPLIVVMPDGGSGFYSDWQVSAGQRPRDWETYHVEELIPWVEAEFRAREDQGGRAVAGVSMGGYGAVLIAARHPELFAFAASLSGPVVLAPGPVKRLLATAGRPALAERIWGPFKQQREYWRDHNPVDLAGALASVELVLSTGNGVRAAPGLPADPVERQIRAMNVTLHRRLRELGVRHTFDDYGPGVHDVGSWRDALRRALPRLTEALGEAPASG